MSSTSYSLPTNVCEDGTKCPNGGICVKSKNNPGTFHCDCDYVEENQKYEGMPCLHLLPADCTASYPDLFPVSEATGGHNVVCFNEGTCEVMGMDGESGCDCKAGFSGDLCQFLGDPDDPKNEPVFCPDGQFCEPGSLCYEDPDKEGEYYCDCHHGGPNVKYENHNCFHEEKLNCSQVLGLSDPNHVCFNGATCTGGGSCNCVEGFTGPACQWEASAVTAVEKAGGSSGGLVTGLIIVLVVVAGATFYALGMKRRASKPSEERKPTFFAAGGRPQSDIIRAQADII